MMRVRLMYSFVSILALASVAALLSSCNGARERDDCPPPPPDPGIADYALDHCRTYRYVVRQGGEGERYVLIRGAQGEETQADGIEVTPDSNLRLVNEFGVPIRVWIEAPSGKTIFGFGPVWIEIPADEFVDLRVQARADTDAEAAAPLRVLALENGNWSARPYGDTDPNLKVKPYP